MGTTEAQVRHLIQHYVDFRNSISVQYWQDHSYVHSVFALADVPTVSSILAATVRSDDPRAANSALLLVRDVVNYSMVPGFHEHVRVPPLFGALCDAVGAPHYDIRRASLDTIERIWLKEALPSLVAAFPRYLERDPLGLPDLLFAIIKFSEPEARWELLERAAAAPLYLSRWAALDDAENYVAADQPEQPGGRWLERFYNTLTQDGHPFVRAEGTYKLAMLRLGWEGRSLGKGERRRRYRALRATEPEPTFFRVSHFLTHHLLFEELPDYTIELMDAIARFCHDQPFTPELGLDGYLQAFAAWWQGGA